MRDPSPPRDGNSPASRSHSHGAIRTHLGRKRVGARGRPLAEETLLGVRRLDEMRRGEQERLFDRLKGRFHAIYDTSQDKTAADFDRALDQAAETLVVAGELTADSAERLRQLLRRDLLQRDHPEMTFPSGDITTGGTLACEGCNWTIIADRTTVLPLCPQCGETSFRKAA
jgi:hypothetical protein